MGKGAKLISFPLLPQAWQMKKLTWLSSSRAPAPMSRSPQVLLHSWCQLSPLTPWCTVSNPLKNIWSRCFLQWFLQKFHTFLCQILGFNSNNTVTFVRIRHRMLLWMYCVAVDTCDTMEPQDHITQGKFDTNDHGLRTSIINTSLWHLLAWRVIVNRN